MSKVLMVWMEANPSTMEKNHLMLNGLVKNGVETFALGFCHSRSNIEYFETVFSNKALYSYEFTYEGSLYSGNNAISKILNNLGIMLSFFRRLLSFCKNERFSCIVMPPQPFELTLPTMLVGKYLGIKIIPNIMEYYPSLPNFHKRKNFLQRISWHIVTKYSDAYIVISKFLKIKFEIYRKEIFILPAIMNSVDEIKHNCDTDNPNENVRDGVKQVPTIIYTSSYAYTDLLEFCLKALSKVNDTEYEFVITGNYPDNIKQDVLEFSNKNNINNVVFSGFLTDEELHGLQMKSCGLLIPLLNDDRHCARFPQKVLGYMALGKPIVTTSVGELAEYFTGGENAYMDESISANGYADKIKLLLSSPDMAQEIGAHGRVVVLNTFNDKTWGSKLKVYLERIQGL